jgi:hypothetical protein
VALAVDLNTSGKCMSGLSCNIGTATTTEITLTTDGGVVTVDGTITGGLRLVSAAASGALTINRTTLVTATADYSIPDNCDSATGSWVTIVLQDASETASISLPNEDIFVIGGLAAFDAGDELDSPTAGATTAGVSITLQCLATNKWYSTGTVGAWVDGGAT